MGFAASPTVNLSGKITISGNTSTSVEQGASDLALGWDTFWTINIVGELDPESQIGVTMVKRDPTTECYTGTDYCFTKGWAKSGLTDSSVFFSDNTGYYLTIDSTSGELYQEKHESHPICGASCSDDEKHQGTTWTAWTSTTSLPTEAGSYFLTGDVTLANTWTVSKDVVLCLNGFTVKRSSYGSSVISVADGVTFTLTDCVTATFKEDGSVLTGGKITGGGGGNYQYAGGVYVNSKATFTMYGGVISKNYGYTGGGVYVNSEATFTMYGGVISKNSYKEGGGVYVNSKATFTMYGGTITDHNTWNGNGGGVYVSGGSFTMIGGSITGNTARDYGGGVLLYNGATFDMQGGSITGNTAGDYGGGVYVNSDSFNVSGSAQITGNTLKNGTTSNVYLPKDKTITVSGKLDETASIGVTLANSDQTFTSGWTTSGNTKTSVFFSDNLERFAGVKNRELYMRAHEGHPICGASCSDDEKHQGTTWTVWKSTTSLPSEAGNYYLLADVTLTETWTPADGTVLCLAGHTITYAGENSRAITVTGQFTLTDCIGTGKVTGGKASYGGGVYVSGAFTMYGGTITGNNSSSLGGGVYVSGGTFNMIGGSVTGNTADYGGGVYVDTGSLILSGGSITDNTASYGGGVYCKSGTVTISGAPKITGNTGSNVYLPEGKTITIGEAGLSSGASIGVTLEKGTGAVTGTTSKDYSDYFTCDNSSYMMLYYKSAVYLGKTHIHPICGAECEYETDPDVKWVEWTSDNSLPSESGYYFLAKDVTLTRTWTPANGTVLCLNGHSVSYADDSVITVLGSNTFTLTDCGADGKVTGGNGTYGGGVYVLSKGTFNLYGGSITGNTADYGGGVYVASKASFHLYGGSITGNTLTDGKTKSNVYLSTGTTITISGKLDKATSIGVTTQTPGTFTSGWSKYENVPTTVFTSDDTDYQVQTTSTSGGTELMIHKHSYDDETGICACGYHQHDVEGTAKTFLPVSTLTDDMAAGSYVLTGNVTLTSTWTPKNSITLDLGGYSISCTSGDVIAVGSGVTLTITDCKTTGTILGQEVSEEAVYSVSSAVTVSGGTFTLDGGTIQGNSSIGVSVTSGTFNLNGGKITGCAVQALSLFQASAGGVYVSGGTFNMTGGEITGNSVTQGKEATDADPANGGGVNLVGGTFNMTGGTITGNTAKNYGGGVYVGGGIFNVSGTAQITGNTGSNTGSNVYLSGSNTITVDGELKSGAAIGVTMQNAGTFTSGWSSKNSTNSAFTSDSSTYVILAVTASGTTELTLHQHSYSYSGSGDTITATCSDTTNCGDTKTAQLKLKENQSLVYTGSAIEPMEVEYSTGWPGGTLTINYQSNVNAGTNTASASITVKNTNGTEATATKTFSIGKAAVTSGTLTVSMNGYAYGGTVSTPTLSGTYAGGGTVTYYYYQTSNDNPAAFADVTNTTLSAGTYHLYATIAATDNYEPYTTAAIEFVVSNADQTAPAAGVATIDYANETITFGTDYEMNTSTDGGAKTAVTSGSAITPGSTYYIRAMAAANYNASAWTTITIASRPTQPSNLEVTAETSRDQKNGKITGVDSTMEYKLSTATSWTAITGTEVTNLAAGTYQVRVKATATTFCSAITTVTVSQGNTLTVTLNSNGGSTVITGLIYNAVVTLPTPTRTGYTFNGWYDSSEKKVEETTINVTTNVAYTAKWTLNAPAVNNEQGYTGTYDGKSHEISVTASHDLSADGLSYQWQKGSGDNWTNISGATNATYSVKNVNDSGSYRCVVTYADGTQTKTVNSEAISVTISKAALTITANAKTITYGDAPTNGGVSYSGFVNNETASVLGGTLSYSYSYTQYGKVGNTYTITPSGLTSSNYAITFADGTLTVQAKSITATVTASEKVYDGTDTATVSASVSADQLVNGNQLSISGLTGTFENANVGAGKTVTVDTTGATVSGNNDGNYSISYATDNVTANITQKALTITANAKTITYGDAPTNDGVSYSGFVNNETASVLGGELTYSYSYTQYGKVGNSYTITPSGLTSSNYAITFKTGTLTVQAKSITATVTASEKVYDGTNTATVSASVSADQLVNGNQLSISGLTGTFENANVGTGKTVTVDTSKASVTGNDNGNYSISYATTGVTANITQKALTITANAKTITYGDAPANDGVSYSGFVNGETASVLGGTLSYTYSYTQYDKVGNTYTITPSGLTSSNYAITFADGTLTVQAKSITATVTASEKVYDGTNTATVSASVSADQLVNGNQLSITGLTGTFENANVGEGKTVTVDTTEAAVTGNDNGNYSISYATTGVTANITQKALTITANAKAITYGDAPTNDGVSYDGFVNNETASVLGGTLSYSYSYTQYGNVGNTYTITPSGLTSSNYNITFVDGTLTVQPKSITATVTASEKVYDGINTATVTASVKASDLVSNDSLSITGLTGTFENANVGTGKTVTVDTSKASVTGNDNGNYSISYATENVTANITKATVTVTAVAASKTYGDADPELTYTAGTLANGNSFSGSLARVAGETVGEYDITVGTLSAGSNYTISFTGAKFTINKATVTVSEAIASAVYNGTVQTANISDTSLYTVSENKGGTNVGDYKVKLTLRDSTNYAWSDSEGATKTLTFSITQATNEWTTEPSISGWTYGGIASTPAGAAKFGTVKVEYKAKGTEDSTYTTTVPTNAGDYTVRFTVEGTKDYTGLSEVRDLTINQKSITGAEITLDGTLTYNGTEQTQGIKSVTADGLTVTYTVSGDKQTNAGNYTLTVTGNGNFTGTATQAWSIAQKNITGAEITLGDALTYSGEVQTQSIKSVKVDNLDVTYTVSGDKQTDAGDYTLTITGNGNFTGTATQAWSIAAKSLTITADAQTKKYSEADPTLTYKTEGLVEGDTVTGSLARVAGETVGEYNITVGTLSAGSNYTISFTGAKFTINKATVTVSEAIASAVYNGTVQTADIQDTNLYTVSENKGGTNVGDYDVKLTLKDSTNYAWSDSEGATKTLIFSITQATNEWTTEPSISGWTYGGTASTPAGAAKFGTVKVEYKVKDAEDSTYTTTVPTNAGDYTVRFTVEGTKDYTGLSEVRDLTIKQKNITGAEITLDGTLTYKGTEQTQKISGVKVDNLEVTYTVSGDKQTNAGNYTLTVTGSGNFTGTATQAWSIAAKSLTITADAQTKKYSEADPTLTYKTEGLVEGDAITGSLARAEGEAVGTYEITRGTLDAGSNYTISFTGAKFTINKAIVTVSEAIASAVYNGTVQTANISDTNLYTVSENKGGTNVGDYDVKLTLKDSTNYAWSDSEGATKTLIFSITQATNEWTTEPSISGWTYGGTASTPAGAAKFGTVKVEYKAKDAEDSTYTATVPTNAGDYTVRFTVKGTKDYTGLSEVRDLTISKALLTITADAQTKKYSEADPTLTYKTEGLVEGDTITGSLARAEGEAVGTYKITQGTLDAGSNYTISFTGAALTILANSGATIENTTTNEDGNEVVTKVNDENKVVETIVTDQDGNVTKTEYQENGNTLMTKYDSESQLTESLETYQEGGSTQIVYNNEAGSNEKTVRDASGEITEHRTTFSNGSYLLDGFDPEIIEGDGSKFDGESSIKYRSNDELENFIEVRMDGKLVAPENYIVSRGSIRIDLKPEYLATLEPGDHILTIASLNGDADGTLIVPEEKVVVPPAAEETPTTDTNPTKDTEKSETTDTNPTKNTEKSEPTDTTKTKDTVKSEKTTETVKAGDNSHLELWVVMFLLSAGGVVGCTTYTRRKREKKSK
jgi:uncharacterized repeat protein (TIGR02543 family)